MSGDYGVVEADIKCAMFALTTPVLQGGGDKGTTSGLDSWWKGMAGLDQRRNEAEAVHHCASGKGLDRQRR
jgi:hypothetical protein